MSWNNAAWAIDGAQMNADLARLAEYAAVGGAEGIISRGDLKVVATGPASGNVKVNPGGVLIRNRSTGTPDGTYVALNEAGADELVAVTPTGAGVTRSDLVLVRVKDPQFAPWPAPPAGTELTYQYVETFVVANVDPTTVDFTELEENYSAYALARIDIPANTAVFTDAMIVDLRKVARPRSESVQAHLQATAADTLNPAVGVYELFPQGCFVDVDIPEWAVTCKIMGFVEGLRLTKAGNGKLRVAFVNGNATQVTAIDDSAAAGTYPVRRSYNIGGEVAVPSAIRGNRGERIRIEGTINNSGSSAFLETDVSSSGALLIRFEEKAE